MIERIRVKAIAFRDGIEMCDRSKLPVSMQDFPRGACGDTVALLGTFLFENGLGEFAYVLGEIGSYGGGNWSTHAWLQRGDLVVDITADQFRDIDDAVIVTTQSSWHRSLGGKQKNVANFRKYDAHSAAELARAYREILKHL
jgi:hypothetical protein